MLLRQRIERVLSLLADRQDLAFERILVGAITAAGDDRLADARHLLESVAQARLEHRPRGGSYVAILPTRLKATLTWPA